MDDELIKDWMERAARYGPRPSLTVDGILLVDNKLVLIQRKNPPFQGQWALPGGFVDYGETVEQAVVREMEEETGVKTSVKKLFGVYSAPDRDPRHHTISAVFKLEKIGGELKAADDARKVDLFSLENIPSLAFDHGEIVADLLKTLSE